MKIEVDDDFLDDLIAGALIEGYISAQNNLKNKTFWHKDDVASLEELLPALKIVGNWYCYDFENKVKKARKKK